MNRSLLFNIVLAAMIVVTVAALGALSEERLDVYVSFFTLEYLVGLTLLRPRRRTIDFLAITLLAAFLVIAGIRVAEVVLP